MNELTKEWMNDWLNEQTNESRSDRLRTKQLTNYLIIWGEMLRINKKKCIDKLNGKIITLKKQSVEM